MFRGKFFRMLSTEPLSNDSNLKYVSEFEDKIENTQMPYSLACMGVIHTKNPNKKSHASVFLN